MVITGAELGIARSAGNAVSELIKYVKKQLRKGKTKKEAKAALKQLLTGADVFDLDAIIERAKSDLDESDEDLKVLVRAQTSMKGIARKVAAKKAPAKKAAAKKVAAKKAPARKAAAKKVAAKKAPARKAAAKKVAAKKSA